MKLWITELSAEELRSYVLGAAIVSVSTLGFAHIVSAIARVVLP